MKRRTLVRMFCGVAFGLVAHVPRAETLLLEEWQGLVPDSALVLEDKPALAWPKIDDMTSSTAAGVPEDLSRFRTLSFRLHVAEPKESVLTVIFLSENPTTPGSDYYSVGVKTTFAGWRAFRFPLSMLSAARKPLGWDQIQRVFINSKWAHKLDPETVVHLAAFTLDTTPIPGLEQPSGELLVNRSFELVTADGAGAIGWGAHSFHTAAKISVDNTTAASGQRSIRIEGAPGNVRAGLSKSFGPELTDPDALYLMTMWVKADGRSEHPLRTSVRFTSINADGRVIKSDYRRCSAGPFDWRPVRWLIELPQETHRFNIVLFHHGDGTAWWDDVSLRKLHPTRVLAPEMDAPIADCQPEFAWEATADAEGVLTVASQGDGAFFKQYEVTGNRFRLPERLPEGHTYTWFVTAVDGEMSSIAVFSSAGKTPRFGRLFSGSWQDRTRAMLGDLSVHRRSFVELADLAERNGMWDKFSLLGDLLASVDAVARDGKLPPGVTVEHLQDALNELQLRLPWWRKIFLEDESLFADLDLEIQGLEAVSAAVSRRNFPAARKALLTYYRGRKSPSYYRKWERRPSRNPARKTDPRAEKLLTHQMSIHSYETPTFDLGAEFDWHVFPIVDVEWPTKIHRHFHWQRLAKGYWSTGNESYAREVALQMLDWGMDNPMERWDRHRYRWAWSTLNATCRIYSSWLNSWLAIRDSASWTPDAQFVMLTLLREHGHFLMTHFARQGNWVVAEARGLVELGIMFPEFKTAEAWREEGFRRLRKEVDIQVLPDGVHVERTPGYHGMTLSCFMEPLRLALLNEVTFEGRDHFLAKLEKMHEFYLYGCRPDWRMAQIGDSGMMSVVSRLSQGAQLFRREDMRYIASDGKEGVKPVHRSYAFDSAGFYVSRSEWGNPDALWSIMDWGGFLGHCHEDMGHISLYAYGAPLLIDSGIFAYSWPLRKYFHWTVGHNTVMVDGKPQKHRDPLSCVWRSNEHFDYTRGLTDNSEPLLHERTLVFRQPASESAGYWVVLDRLSGEGEHRLDQRWHTSEKMAGRVEDATVVFTGRDEDVEQPSLTLAGLQRPALQTTIEGGFVSYKWYKKLPVDVAQFTQETNVPAVFVTVLYPTPAGVAPPQVTVSEVSAFLDGQAAQAAEATAFTVSVGEPGRSTNDRWVFRHRDEGTVLAGDLTVDARMACVRDGQTWLAVDCRQLSSGEHVLVSSAEMVDVISRVGEAVSCSTLATARLLAEAPLLVNGSATNPPVDGYVTITEVTPAAIPDVPRTEGEASLEIPGPPPPIEATGFAKMLPKDAPRTSGAIVMNAADIAAQGGGNVEITTTKVGAEGKAFLHWDRAGHWLEYVASVPRAGQYRLLLRACTNAGVVVRRIDINGKVIPAGKALEIAGTGGFSGSTDDWRMFVVADLKAVPAVLNVPAGEVRIRLENVDGQSLNLNWLALVAEWKTAGEGVPE